MADDQVKTGDAPEADADLEDHPGKPRDPDEIDPELVSLSKPRVSVGPILSASIVAFCAYMMVQLYADLRFSRQSEEPRPASDVSEVASRQGFGPDEYIRVRATPDRSLALLVAPRGTTDGHRVAPVLGTGGKLWLMVGSEPWAERAAYADIYTGRLRDLDDMPFAGALRDHLRDRGATPQTVTGEAVREALAEGGHTIRRPSGDAVEIRGDTPVEIAETVHGRAQIRAFLRKDRLPDAATWNRVLTEAGILPAGVGPVATEEDHLVYQVPAPDGVEGVKKALIDAQLFAARAEPLIRRHETTWGELRAGAGGVDIGGGVVLPWANLTTVTLRAPRAVPSDAMVLVTDDAPGAYWFVLPLYIILGLFVVLFAWALIRAVMPERAAERASKEAQSAA